MRAVISMKKERGLVWTERTSEKAGSLNPSLPSSPRKTAQRRERELSCVKTSRP